MQVTLKNFKGFTNSNCEFFPCHSGVNKKDFNCLFCYCPLINLQCPGPYKLITNKYGLKKDCSDCSLNHDGIIGSWKFIQMWTSVNLPFDGQEQTPNKVKYNTQLVKQIFDKSDLLWCEFNE